ncbi:MAG: isoleucine--tRNA ligase [Candidatus Aenigmatarchaeota archaeon]|nr:MAG: isoleucine--tRNA ligase [Candidatus Aenigmarchaeota archaeon]
MFKPAPDTFTNKDEERYAKGWWDGSLYKKLRASRSKGKGFYLCFGPPYPTGHLHLGTALNGIWKDIASRYKFMRGFDVENRPGWDMHGLPIENKVEKAHSIDKTRLAEFGIERFIEECKRFSTGNMQIMTEEFKNLGCLVFDWDNPYRTMAPEYMFGAWFVVKRAQERGLLSKGKYPVSVCPRCQTTLSNAEAVHKTRKDSSVFVTFKTRNDEHLMAWTTTPWTLPSNTGIMVHPDYVYAKVEVDGKKVWAAKELLAPLMKRLGKHYTVLEEKTGKKLEGIEYEPLLKGFTPLASEREGGYRVILSRQYVTLDAGTGLVHTAPGHGREDFFEGTGQGLPLINPIGLDGRYKKEAGPNLAGRNVTEANEEITAWLRANGKLFHTEQIEHEYPHCWRCSTPLLQLAMDNWFIRSTEYRDALVKENGKVNWIPDHAKRKTDEWFRTSLTDWPITRQRYWGVPLPIWDCKACGRATIIGSLEELQKLATASVPDDFDPHIPYIDAVRVKCECGAEATRIPDIMDVWLESSVASWSALDYPTTDKKLKKYWPADLNIEGRDQIRGWWNAQTNASVLVFDKAPFKNVLINSWMLDASGIKMSKSVGNVIHPNTLVEKYGRDATRLYMASLSPDESVKYSEDGLAAMKKTMDTLWNSYKFFTTYANADGYTGKGKAVRRVEDRWLLSRINTLAKECEKNFEAYEFQNNPALVQDFVMNDLSRWYIKLVRERVGQNATMASRNAVYATLGEALVTLSKILAPLAPFMSDGIYGGLSGDNESVHFQDWPTTARTNTALERSMDGVRSLVEACLALRDESGIGLRYPLKKVVVAGSKELLKAAKDMDDTIRALVNVKDVETVLADVGFEVKLNYATAGPKYGKDVPKIAKALAEADATKIAAALKKEGKAKAGSYTLTKDEIVLRAVAERGRAFSSALGWGTVELDLTSSRELEEEAFVRELSRAVQQRRKELGLKVSERVALNVNADSNAMGALRRWEGELKKRTGSSRIVYNASLREARACAFKDLTAEFEVVK